MENREIKPCNCNCFEPEPGTRICYHSISLFLNNCLPEKNGWHNFQVKRNRLFKEEDFRTVFLSPGEIEMVNRFKSLKKQVEWMAGRFLVKTMVQKALNNEMPMTEITVMHQDEGAPFIKDLPGIRISISHSGDYAAVALTTREGTDIGLDIEEIGKAPDSAFMKTAFSQNELASMGTMPRDIFQQWTTKEAFLKYIKKGFNESLYRVEVINGRIYHHGMEAPVSILTRTIGTNYSLSLVTGAIHG
ncbi:MAG: 4'-phosphopantetheinyl transferase superfamily protein [Desulfobacteraceae bacterium]|nr:4'-phosphopantetheinyl transferase superfamily protein [Desulfobacteraceae bacterium]